METIDRRTFAGAIASGVVMNSSALAGQEFEEKKMVWGMREPGSFGDYFPDGDCVGWDEKLSWYYANEMSDAEKTEMEMQDRILY
ncbi:MAG: hypothetical protein GY746_12595, partial [Gammaproteobacteria bacterium]|nr:hypothetical protein [Gammaproteobacteria bacterium]